MSSLFFWNAWSRSYRLAYLTCLILFGISLVLLAVAWARGLANVVRWNVLSELNPLQTTIYRFTDGLLDYPVTGNVYVVSEQFVASAMQTPPGLATALLVGIGVAFVLIVSAITRFDRLRYLVAMGVLIIGLAFFRWEMLELPGLGQNYLFLLLTFLYGSVSYYFHAFRSDYPIGVRLAVFGTLTGMVAAVLTAFTPVPHPALTIISYGMPVLVVLSAGFIFFIAAEIIAGLVWITSVGRAGGQPLGIGNFLFISGLYLVNLILIWLKNTKIVDWDVLAISPFGVYIVSVIIGVWGFRRLIDQQNVVSFRDGGAFLYAGLALLATLTIAYAFATANDPLIEVFEDMIVYAHLAMGLAFISYVLINFWPIFKQGRAVHKIVYNPKRLELSLFRLMGVFGVVVLVSMGNNIVLRQSLAAYYNGLGDLYIANSELESAGAFYEKALEQEFQNHKSNYALASLAMTRNDQATAAFYYERATLKQPQPHDYAGIAQTYLQTSLFFEAIKALQRGLRKFPDSGELQNNLGFLYARTSVADSAYYYLKAATNQATRAEVAEANLLALYARNPVVLTADSTLVQETNRSDYESYQANALALRLITASDTTQPAQPVWLSGKQANEGLSVGRFASLYNYAVVNQRPDTVLLSTLQRWAENPINQDFADDLLLARALTAYRAYDQPTAFGLLSQLAEGNPQNGPAIRTTTGLLLLEQGLYRKAAEQFGENTDTTSAYYPAIALTKAGDPVLAQSLWETAAKGDVSVAALKQVLYDERPPQTDLEKAFYVTYRPDDPNRGRHWETIRDASLRTVSGTRLIDEYLATRQPFYAQMILSQMGKPEQLTPYARSLENLSALRIAVYRNKLAAADSMSKAYFLPQHQAERLFLLGRIYAQNKQPAKAWQAFASALRLAPLNASIVATAAQFERQRGRIKPAYDLVLRALPFNEDSPDLLKTYVSLCLDQSLFDYAREGLAKLQGVSQPADYQAFQTTYQEKLAAVEKSRKKFSE
ncbi:hypothetical protein [Spirosoma montaniterrae]|uniref:Tetratricopeptide repeat protein n=1 Tax=Spirosoma montaniterrae TaxID=1178516 RepID=A0A1P9X0V9_9BACT|nr:hypothetical protein [Spirosoma montaniterrae]AQG81215.1 hypothetical protein AWR27_18945 [Spirosoma montaniterrae]